MYTKEMRNEADHAGGLPTLDEMVRKGVYEETILSRGILAEEECQPFIDSRYFWLWTCKGPEVGKS